MATNTEAAELVMNIWTRNINRHSGHRGPCPGLRSLYTEAGIQALVSSLHGCLTYHTFVPLPVLGSLALWYELDLEAEAALGCMRHIAIRQMLITRNLTGKPWFMLQVWQQSCGNGECSWS